MKQPIHREVFQYDNGITIELYKMKDSSYTGFAKLNYDTKDEIVGMGENQNRENAIHLAVEDLKKEIKNTL